MATEKLTERFVVRKRDEDRALAALDVSGLMVARSEGATRQVTQRPDFDTLIVVESADEIEDATNETRKKFAEAAGDALIAADVEWLGST